MKINLHPGIITGNKEFPHYTECSICGYRKYCKVVNKKFICTSCTKKGEQNENSNS